MIQEPITGNESNREESHSPYAALVEFYAAFNGGNLESMRHNWLQTEDASMSNPLGGIKRGWEEIESVYDKIFNGAAKVYVEFYDYTLFPTDSMFVAVGRERGTLQMGDTRLELAIRTSRTYVMDSGRWRQLHHHGSMDNPQLLERYQSIVLGPQK